MKKRGRRRAKCRGRQSWRPEPCSWEELLGPVAQRCEIGRGKGERAEPVTEVKLDPGKRKLSA